jgi:hypothetical protein
VLLLSILFGQSPLLQRLFADSAYTCLVVQGGVAADMPNLEIETVKRSHHIKGFVVNLQLLLHWPGAIIPDSQ